MTFQSRAAVETATCEYSAVAIAYRCSTDHRCTFVVWDGDVTPDEWRVHNERLFDDPAFPPGPRMLVDLRSAGGAPSITADVLAEMGKRFNDRPDKLAEMTLAIVPNGSWDKARQLFEEEVAVPGLRAMTFTSLPTACVWLGMALEPAQEILDELRTHLREHSAS
jgi:hypothetical protein